MFHQQESILAGRDQIDGESCGYRRENPGLARARVDPDKTGEGNSKPVRFQHGWFGGREGRRTWLRWFSVSEARGLRGYFDLRQRSIPGYDVKPSRENHG